MVTGSLQIKGDMYYAVLRIPDGTGKKPQKWISTGIKVSGNNKRLANQRLREIISEYNREQVTYSKEILFVDWLNIWVEQKQLRPNTLESYRLYIKVHIAPHFKPLRLTLKTINPQHIDDYYRKKLREGQSANSIHKHNVVIRGALKEALTQLPPPKGGGFKERLKPPKVLAYRKFVGYH